MKFKKASVRLHAAEKDTKKDGTVGLFLLVTIDRKSRFIPLKLYWPAQCYDFTVQGIIQRSKNDRSYADYLLMINQEISKCNDIFVNYRLRDLPLVMDRFLEEYYQYNLKRDFIQYMGFKLTSRYQKKQISEQTKKNHSNALNKVREFSPKGLAFESVTVKWCKNFENHLKVAKSLKINSVWAIMKDMNTYLNLATDEDNIPIKNPFGNGYSCPSKEGSVDAVTMAELKKLHQLLDSCTLPDNQELVLRQFLFSCYTGLRISDLNSITNENIVGDELVFYPVKGRRFEKIQRIPLTNRAKEFIKTNVEGKLFAEFTDQASNRMLKKIQLAAGIPTKLTNHVGRHSFATLLLELGGSVEVVQKILGHTKISTTMKYVHVTKKRMEEQMSNFDRLDF